MVSYTSRGLRNLEIAAGVTTAIASIGTTTAIVLNLAHGTILPPEYVAVGLASSALPYACYGKFREARENQEILEQALGDHFSVPDNPPEYESMKEDGLEMTLLQFEQPIVPSRNDYRLDNAEPVEFEELPPDVC